ALASRLIHERERDVTLDDSPQRAEKRKGETTGEHAEAASGPVDNWLDHWISRRMAVVPFRAPARRRLHEDVAGQPRAAILHGPCAAGGKLPPERELAAEFGVNRTSIREAIKVLEGLGLVTVRQGDGATVRPLVDASLEVLGPMIFHGGRI